MSTEYRVVDMTYGELYPHSPDFATKKDDPIKVREYLMPAIDPTTGEEKLVAVYMDENNHPFIKADLGEGEEKFYPLLGGGAGPIPAMEDGTQSTKKEVLYFDIYNQNGIQEKIYLPLTKDGNADFIDQFKEVFSGTSTAPETSTPRPTTEKITRNAANTYFLQNEHPKGDLVFNKRNKTDGKIDTSYLYISHQNDAGKQDYLRLMKKEGQDKLYINLDNVVNDATATPPTTFANGTTFEVREFLIEPNAAGERVLKANVYDGTVVRTVELPMTEEQAKNSSLFKEDGSGFYTPQEIVARGQRDFSEADKLEKNEFLQIDEKRLPNCGNKRVNKTKQPAPLTGNAFYTKKDADGNVIQTHQYISYMEGAVEKHLQLIQKDGNLYGNFNTDPTHPETFETCLIESIEDDGTVTYVAGDPGKKYTGKLPIDSTTNPEALQDVRAMISGGTPTSTTEINGEQLPDVSHQTVDKNPVDELASDGDLSRRTSTTGEALRETIIKAPDGSDIICQTQNIEFKKGVANPFGSKKQQLSTFAHNGSPTLLAAITNENGEVASITRDTTSGDITLTLSKEQIDLIENQNPDVKIRDYGIENPAGSGRYSFSIAGVQLGQNANLQDIAIRAIGDPDKTPLKIGFSSQGATVSNSETKQSCAVASRDASGNPTPLDVAVSRDFIKEALSNMSKAPADRSACQIETEGSPALPKEPLASSLYVSLLREYRSDCINSRNGLTPDKVNDPLVLCNDPLTMLRSLPTGKIDPSTGKETYVDLRVGPEKDKDGNSVVYFYGHVTVEHEEDKAGGKSVPKWHKLDRAWISELTAPTAVDAPTSTPMLMMETRLEGTNRRSIGIKLGDDYATPSTDSAKKVKEIVSFIHDPTGKGARDLYDSSASTAGKRNIAGMNVDVYARDSRSFSTEIDENVAQLQRGEGTEVTHPAIQTLEDAQPDRAPIAQIDDPEAKTAEDTKDTPRPKPPKEREKVQLWKGIKDDNRKTWIALAAIAMIFSVFIPFLGIVCGALCAVVAANDTEFLKSIFIERENVHKGLTAEGKKYDRELVKNQAKIREINANIDKWNTQIADLEKSGKTPKQIATEKAKLEAKIASAQAEKQALIERDHQLAVLITKDQDKGLREELSSHKKWEGILAKEESRLNTINALGVTVGGRTMNMKDFSFKSSDADLAEYKRQLEILKKEKGNKHVKDILEQQIEFADMVQLYRRDVRKLSAKENARLNRLSQRFSPTSQPPAKEWSERIGKLIVKTGLTPADKTATGLKNEVENIFNSLKVDPTKSSNQLLNRPGMLYNHIYFNLYGTKAKGARDGKLLRTIDRIKGCADETALNKFIMSEGARPHCEDLVKLKYLLLKDTLTPDEITLLNNLTKKYPKIANNKNFDLLAELENERIAKEADIKCMDEASALIPSPPATIDPDYYNKMIEKAKEARDPKVRSAIEKAAIQKKFAELSELAKSGLLSNDDKQLLQELAKKVDIPEATLKTTPKGAELLQYQDLLKKDKKSLTEAEKAEIKRLKKKYPGFTVDSNAAEYLTEDLLDMSEAAQIQAVAEEIKALTGKELTDLAKAPPEGMTSEEIENLLKGAAFGSPTATSLGVKKVLIDQLEYQEYHHLRDIQSTELSASEKKRLEKLKKKFGSSKSPVDSFLDQSSEYIDEINEYLRKSDEYIQERETRAEQSVTTDEMMEEEAIDKGLADYQAKDTARQVGANVQNQDDKNANVEGIDQEDTAEYAPDGTRIEVNIHDNEGKTTDAVKRKLKNQAKYGADGGRTDGLGSGK